MSTSSGSDVLSVHSDLSSSLKSKSSTSRTSQGGNSRKGGSSVGGSSSRSSGDQNLHLSGHELGHDETKAVFKLRILLLFILFLAASGVSAFVYILTRQAEDTQFHSQYDGAATIVLEKFENILSEHVAAISTVSVATVAHSIDHHRDWPFVSLSFIQQRFAKTNQIAGTLYISFCPFVKTEDKDEWESFTNNTFDRQWIPDGLDYQRLMGLNHLDEVTAHDPLNASLVGTISMAYDTEDGSEALETGEGPYLPVWQTSPVLRQGLVNKNQYRNPVFAKWANLTMIHQQAFFGEMAMAPPGYSSDKDVDRQTQFFATILSYDRGTRTQYLGDPITNVFIPVYDSFNENRKSVGILQAVLHWGSYFRKILPPNTPGMTMVLDNSCDGSFSYEIKGKVIEPLGEGDRHDTRYTDDIRETSFFGHENIGDGTVIGLTLNQDECQYKVRVYPTEEFYNTYYTSTPMIMTIAVAAIFIFTTATFFFYDHLVERRQSLVLKKATQSDAIVSSLFPKTIRDRLMQDSDAMFADVNKKKSFLGPQHRLKNYLGGGDTNATSVTGNMCNDNDNHAIADLFPNCTVLFADIVGFTAWSSARDPTQVFDLLQTIYQSFDLIAQRRRVFKVETIGDCYVAVTGLPEPQANHAVIMAKFAGACNTKLSQITTKLEVTLGPDTGDLGMRFGLHSGPVTAGVLRGDRSRFQLFGDTVNTAARMESTGQKNRIQISQVTADILLTAGRDYWVEPRKDAVKAKGKGIMNTFWLNPYAKKSSASSSSGDGDEVPAVGGSTSNDSISSGRKNSPLASDQTAISMFADEAFMSKHQRRIDWVSKLLQEQIQRVVARREATKQRRQLFDGNGTKHAQVSLLDPNQQRDPDRIPLDEVQDKIILNNLDMNVAMKEVSHTDIRLDANVKAQLRDYVSDMAGLYHQTNPFHSFEHACHVTMSVVKLLKRIVTPDLDVDNLKTTDLVSKLHDYTYGITSDPLAILAIMFSALIHDVDHRGVGNNQLINEEPEMACHYQNKSIAEQNSLDIAWDNLMRHKYKALRNCIFGDNDQDFEHFRQVAVNVVLATDIFDKELNAARKDRWDRAFSPTSSSQATSDTSSQSSCEHRMKTVPESAPAQEQSPKQPEESVSTDSINLRATIVIEHIIQASDVAHTMQHWHVYQRWNERLFQELMLAYKSGRLGTDPATFWYKGEIGFFDNYIIPLAKKLKECGVFGVSSDEYLNYARSNRDEWEEKGEQIVQEYIENFERTLQAEN